MSGWTTGFMMAIGLVVVPVAAASQPDAESTTKTEILHVRSRHQELRAMIRTATEQSPTFRQMVETINKSNGIVYVEAGRCVLGVRACLATVTSAGGHRSLFVKVHIYKSDRALMAALGHELRHAIEVLSEPGVTDHATMCLFYRFNQDRINGSLTFETKAAVEAGYAVADEIGRFQRAKDKR